MPNALHTLRGSNVELTQCTRMWFCTARRARRPFLYMTAFWPLRIHMAHAICSDFDLTVALQLFFNAFQRLYYVFVIHMPYFSILFLMCFIALLQMIAVLCIFLLCYARPSPHRISGASWIFYRHFPSSRCRVRSYCCHVHHIHELVRIRININGEQMRTTWCSHNIFIAAFALVAGLSHLRKKVEENLMS